MIDAFFDLEYKGNSWFDGLQISEHPECDRHRSGFPAICIDLKDIDTGSIDGFLSDYKYETGVPCTCSPVSGMLPELYPKGRIRR